MKRGLDNKGVGYGRWIACGVAAAWLALPVVARAEDSRALLLAAYVPPSVLRTDQTPAISLSTTKTPGRAAELDSLSWPLADQLRRERFEAEYMIRDKSPSLVLGSLQTVKYNLDKSVFELDNFVNRVSRSLEFDLNVGNSLGFTNGSSAPNRVYFSPLRDVLENTRLKSSVELNAPAGRAYIGLHVVFPVGN